MARGPEPREGTLGWRLKQAAKKAGKTAEQLSREIGSSDATIRRWWKAGNEGVRGHVPSAEDMQAYADAVECTVEELVGGEGALPRSLSEALVIVFRGLISGQDLRQSIEASGRTLSQEDEARMTPAEVEVIRRFLRSLGALTDDQLRSLIQQAYRSGQDEGRRGGTRSPLQ